MDNFSDFTRGMTKPLLRTHYVLPMVMHEEPNPFPLKNRVQTTHLIGHALIKKPFLGFYFCGNTLNTFLTDNK